MLNQYTEREKIGWDQKKKKEKRTITFTADWEKNFKSHSCRHNIKLSEPINFLKVWLP